MAVTWEREIPDRDFTSRIFAALDEGDQAEFLLGAEASGGSYHRQIPRHAAAIVSSWHTRHLSEPV
jgi:hypothetical protein